MRHTPLVVIAALVLFGWHSPDAVAESSGGPRDEAPALRLSDRPSKLELHFVQRWLEDWRRSAGPVELAVADLRPDGRGAPHLEKAACMDLAAALLELDRRAVLPAPDAAVSFHLERGLRRLARTAVTCLTRRRYAARRALEEARGAFGEAERLLRRYELGAGSLGDLAR
ncbi:MAG: hypothetical protein ACLF0P_00355 [Thermoanaerobaculia bacterium]